MVAHEAPVYAGLGAEIAARVTEQCFYHLEAPVLRVGGFATPYPPSRLEDHYLPDLDRILDAVDRTFWVLSAEKVEHDRDSRSSRLPDVGEGLTEADIVAWHVKPGDKVEDNQIIVEIETAKAVVELPRPWAGRSPGCWPRRARPSTWAPRSSRSTWPAAADRGPAEPPVAAARPG